MLAKELATLYETVQEFTVVVRDDPSPPGEQVVGCGALHVLWGDLGEVRTLAVDPGVARPRHRRRDPDPARGARPGPRAVPAVRADVPDQLLRPSRVRRDRGHAGGRRGLRGAAALVGPGRRRVPRAWSTPNRTRSATPGCCSRSESRAAGPESRRRGAGPAPVTVRRVPRPRAAAFPAQSRTQGPRTSVASRRRRGVPMAGKNKGGREVQEAQDREAETQHVAAHDQGHRRTGQARPSGPAARRLAPAAHARPAPTASRSHPVRRAAPAPASPSPLVASSSAEPRPGSRQRCRRCAACTSARPGRRGRPAPRAPCEPSDGPTMSRLSIRSISRPALANPTRSLRCSIDVEPNCVDTTSSTAAMNSSMSSPMSASMSFLAALRRGDVLAVVRLQLLLAVRDDGVDLGVGDVRALHAGRACSRPSAGTARRPCRAACPRRAGRG